MKTLKILWRIFSGICILITLYFLSTPFIFNYSENDSFIQHLDSSTIKENKDVALPEQTNIIERYKNGQIKTSSLIELAPINPKFPNHYRPYKTIWQCAYDINGNLVGAISNGIGVRVSMNDSGHFIEDFAMEGFKTNVQMSFWQAPHHENPSIQNIELNILKNDGSLTTIFDCNIDKNGKITYLTHGRGEAIMKDGILMITDSTNVPNFLFGDTVFTIPTLSNGSLVFDKEIRYTNGCLSIKSIPEQSKHKIFDCRNPNDFIR